MPEQPYHLVIRGGTVATGRGAFAADVAISGESIAAIGRGLPAGAREIDAKGKLVLPGGIDPHAHIEQVSAAGILNAVRRPKRGDQIAAHRTDRQTQV